MYQRDLETNLIGVSAERVQSLVYDPEFMLSYNLVSLAKNHNFFSQIDTYLKELARITLTLPHKHIKERLEESLSKEVCIASNID